MPHTPTDMSKWWTRSSCKLCQKLVISPFQSEISDVPAGCMPSHVNGKNVMPKDKSVAFRQNNMLTNTAGHIWKQGDDS